MMDINSDQYEEDILNNAEMEAEKSDKEQERITTAKDTKSDNKDEIEDDGIEWLMPEMSEKSPIDELNKYEQEAQTQHTGYLNDDDPDEINEELEKSIMENMKKVEEEKQEVKSTKKTTTKKSESKTPKKTTEKTNSTKSSSTTKRSTTKSKKEPQDTEKKSTTKKTTSKNATTKKTTNKKTSAKKTTSKKEVENK